MVVEMVDLFFVGPCIIGEGGMMGGVWRSVKEEAEKGVGVWHRHRDCLS